MISLIDKFDKQIKRGDVFYADLSSAFGSEQGGVRPVVSIQNDTGNKYSPTLIVLPITSQNKKYIPTHVYVGSEEGGLSKESTVLCEQIRTLDKSKLRGYIGKFSYDTMKKINQALCVSLALLECKLA